MSGPSPPLDPPLGPGLGLWFGLQALANVWFAQRQWVAGRGTRALVFLLLGAGLAGWAAKFYHGHGLILPASFRAVADASLNPVTFFIGSVLLFAALFYGRRFFTHVVVGWLLLHVSLLFFGLSLTDANFRALVSKPDNVPIVLLLYSVAYFTWLALRQGVANDDRLARGLKPIEAEGAEQVLVWPDLVYIELLAMIVCTVVLLVWSLCLKAPLEAPASATHVPNPSKAPWYFLGLQEMLVYFDPWIAGVVLPAYIIVGLCALPYLDTNPQGNGYYTVRQRPLALGLWLFGFLVLWVLLIVLGTFFRGPNWTFFGLYETWSAGKTIASNNVNLSDIVWLDLLGRSPPTWWLAREWPGLLLLGLYLLGMPLLLGRTVWRATAAALGAGRFALLCNLTLVMAALPIKMLLRWTLHLKYLVFIPDYACNI